MGGNAPEMTNGNGLGGFLDTLGRVAEIARPFVRPSPTGGNGEGQDSQGQERTQVAQQESSSTKLTLLYVGLGALGVWLLIKLMK